MDVKKKVANMSVRRKIIMAAMFATQAWKSADLYLGSSGNFEKGQPIFFPKRTKLKGWQKQRVAMKK